jgi:LuxR family transcriptional regulator of spore coat protein
MKALKEKLTMNILTPREKEIFQMLVDGKTTKEISGILNICSKTTRNHISNSIIKLGVKNRTQAIILLVKNGLLEI